MSHDQDPDEMLVAQLRAFYAQVDPVPPQVTEFAKEALSWRRLDAELAELLADSTLDEEALALTRGPSAVVRSVTFSAGEVTIDVEIHPDGAQRTLLGQLTPPRSTTIEVQRADDAPETTATSDEMGRFRMTLDAGGPIRMIVPGPGGPSGPGTADAPAIETSWIAI